MMTATAERAKVNRKKLTKAKKQATRPRKPASPTVGGPGMPAGPTPVAKLRHQLMLTQPQFARLLPVSVRTLATLESGAAPTEPVARRLTELGRLTAALAEVIRQESLGNWFRAPNPAFVGLKPVDVIERGESDRLWEMIYYLRSGVPS